MQKILNALLVSVAGGLIVLEISNNFESVIILPAISTVILIFIVLNTVIYLRNKVKIKIIKQNLTEFPYSINFEAENIGSVINSLGSKIILNCLIKPLKEIKKTELCGETCKYVFSLNDNNTSLEYHSPKKFTATTTETEMQRSYYSNFRKYKFYLKNGMNACLYFIDTTNKNVSFAEFYIKKFLYRVFRIGYVKI